MNDISVLRDILLRGIKLSKQGSLARRSPEKAALPDLMTARQGLRVFVAENPKHVEAWHLLSRAEECLLNYCEALAALENAMSLSRQRSRGDLKRMALLKEYIAEWERLPLSPEELQSLGDFLVKAGAGEEQNGRTLKHTTSWLEENHFTSPQDVLAKLKRKGGHTDFMILYNIVRG